MAFFQTIPLLGIFAFMVLACVLAYAAGRRLGWKQRAEATQKAEAPLSATVAAIMGLSAFMMAFTFGVTSGRFQDRITFVIDDAIAIDKVYLRAGYLEEPQRTEIRTLLHDYLSVRTTNWASQEDVKMGIERSNEIQDKLWAKGEEIAKKDMNSEMISLFIESLNDLIDIHTKRVAWGAIRLPTIIWITLYVLTFLSIGVMGYHAGLDESKNVAAHLILIIAFSCVIVLIHDLDRPLEGFLKVNQKPLIDLQHKFN